MIVTKKRRKVALTHSRASTGPPAACSMRMPHLICVGKSCKQSLYFTAFTRLAAMIAASHASPSASEHRSIVVRAAADAEAEDAATSRRGLLAAAAAVVAVSLAPSADAKVAQKAPDPYEVRRKRLDARRACTPLLTALHDSHCMTVHVRRACEAFRLTSKAWTCSRGQELQKIVKERGQNSKGLLSSFQQSQGAAKEVCFRLT